MASALSSAGVGHGVGLLVGHRAGVFHGFGLLVHDFGVRLRRRLRRRFPRRRRKRRRSRPRAQRRRNGNKLLHFSLPLFGWEACITSASALVSKIAGSVSARACRATRLNPASTTTAPTIAASSAVAERPISSDSLARECTGDKCAGDAERDIERDARGRRRHAQRSRPAIRGCRRPRSERGNP